MDYIDTDIENRTVDLLACGEFLIHHISDMAHWSPLLFYLFDQRQQLIVRVLWISNMMCLTVLLMPEKTCKHNLAFLLLINIYSPNIF